MKKYPLHLPAGFVVLMAIFISSASAQWVPSNGLEGGPIYSIAVSGNTLLTTIYNPQHPTPEKQGVFRSTNNGRNWTAVNFGLMIGQNDYFRIIAAFGDTVFAVNFYETYYRKLLRSTDDGENWAAISDSVFEHMVKCGNLLFGGNYDGGIYRSADNGANWTNVTSAVYELFALGVIGTRILAATESWWIFYSDDNGASWTKADPSPLGQFTPFAISSGTLFIGTRQDLYRSADSGAGWIKVYLSGITDEYITAVAISNEAIYIGTGSGTIIRSTNNGAEWTTVNSCIPNARVSSLAAKGNTIFAGTDVGIFVSIDSGTTWTAINSGLLKMSIISLEAAGDTIFAGTDGSSCGIFHSIDNGASWTGVYAVSANPVNSFAVSGSRNIFAGIYGGGVLRSIDNGASWTRFGSGLTNDNVRSLAGYGDSLFAGTYGDGIFRSTDNGANWIQSEFDGSGVGSFAMSGNTVFAGAANGVFLSTDNGKSWTAANSGPTNPRVSSLTVSGNNIFAGTWGGGVFLSTDNGTSWTAANAGLTDSIIISCASTGSAVFALTNSDGVFLYASTGWVNVGEGLPEMEMRDLTLNDHTVFCGTSDGVWRRPLSKMIGAMDTEPQRKMLQKENLSVRARGRTDPDVHIDLALPHSGHVAVQVFNLSGRKTVSLVNRQLPAGSYTYRWDVRGIPPGCYTIRVRAGADTYVKSVPVFR